MLSKVRATDRVPLAADFSSVDGSPLVQHRPTGQWFGLGYGDTVYPVSDLDVKGAGAKGDGSTDDYARIAAAIAAAAATDEKKIVLPAGTFVITSSLALTSSHNELKFHGAGNGLTKIKRGANVPIFTLTNAQNIEFHGIHFDGDYGNRTGKGITLSGTSHYPTFNRCYFEGFSDSAIEFGADAGFRAYVSCCRFIAGSGQTNYRAIHCTGTDTTAMFREFIGTSGNGYIDLDATLDVDVLGGFVARVEIASTCSITKVIGVTWGNGGTAMSIDGANTQVIGCRFAGDVTLNAGMSGAFIANVQTQGTFTDSSVAGNVLIHYHPLSATYEKVARHFLPINLSAGAEIALLQAGSVGDNNFTYTPDSTQTILRWANALTANRTLTLTTTGARNGMTVRVSRPGGDTGGPWTLTVGATGTTLTTLQWCDVTYDGSTWVVTAKGAL